MTTPRPTISFEFFPPKDAEGEERLWDAIDTLRAVGPDFVSVTYGAGGSTRDRTIRIACDIQSRTGFRTIAHLTCVGSTRTELEQVLRDYQAAGIDEILALRGDPQGGVHARWQHTADGLDHADQLVELAAQVGGMHIGVAAFPDGHPDSGGQHEQDIAVLLRKEQLGARFAITQMIFSAQSYIELVTELRSKGSQLAVFPGIMPVTSFGQIQRMLDLSGGKMPAQTLERFAAVADDPTVIKAVGVDVAEEVCRELAQFGVPGFHFYTLNNAVSTLKVIGRLKSEVL